MKIAFSEGTSYFLLQCRKSHSYGWYLCHEEGASRLARNFGNELLHYTASHSARQHSI